MKQAIPSWAGLLAAIVLAAGRAGAADESWVAIHAKKIYPVSGAPIENGWILIRDDKIEAVAQNVELPPSTEVIEAPDLVAMPGLVSPMTRYGLPQSYQRTGQKAQQHVSGELFFEKDGLREFLKSGFTTLGFTPMGSGFPGQGAAVLTSNAQVRAETTYLAVSMRNPAADKRTVKEGLETAKKEIERVEKAKKDFEEQQKKKAEEAKKKAEEEAKKQQEKKPEPPKPEEKKPEQPPKPEEKKPEEKTPEKAEAKPEEFSPPKINPAYQPIVDLIQKKENFTALVQIDNAGDFLQWLDALKDNDIAWALQMENGRRIRLGFFGMPGHDFQFLLDRLPEKRPPVLLRGNLNWRDYSRNWINLPESFRKAGCEVSLMPRTDDVREHQSFLLDLADLVKSGMPSDEVLKAVTLNPAKLLGLGAALGSLEKGKDADVVLLSGEPFDVLTRVERVMVKGKVEYDREKDDGKGRD